MSHEVSSSFGRFWRKPAAAKLRSIRYRFKTQVWNRVCPSIPLPTHLPFGGWWLASSEALSDAVYAGMFDGPDLRFLDRFVKDATTVIDVGAHMGLYTLLMSSRVGSAGHVLAFEPSPREFRRLRGHIRLNRRVNVRTENIALADYRGTMTLYVVGHPWNVSSLRPPRADHVETVSVPVMTLDEYLSDRPVQRIDLMKLDTEGAELKILTGASSLLLGPYRPVIICEINDPVIADGGWEHRGSDLIEFLEARGFRWYSFTADGSPTPLVKASWYDTDLVAVPEERIAELDKLSSA